MNDLDVIKAELQTLADDQYAQHQQRYFKTGPGEYAEGDVFIGIRVPVLRKFAKQHADLAMASILRLLKSEIHEHRMLALLVMMQQFEQGDSNSRLTLYQSYLAHTQYINNWDLVDLSAPRIVGDYLANRGKKDLQKLVKSESLWERRIAVIATFHFIKLEQYDVTLKLAKTLLKDKEDLIHKAVGWMLREIGNRDLYTEELFLRQHHHKMPRTMLRYAIEKFDKSKRSQYLDGSIDQY